MLFGESPASSKDLIKPKSICFLFDERSEFFLGIQLKNFV